MKGILNGNRIQSHRRPFCTPKPDADLCMRVSLPLDKKTVENQDWATGPPGRQAARPLGPWAEGPRAAGLLLAKPTVGHTKRAVIPTPGLFIERNYAAVSFNNLCRK